jgi:demethylmenaquinone methyltransferase / 2-methoxy-6-polyprenyl-1,4-benzoquinol methylase
VTHETSSEALARGPRPGSGAFFDAIAARYDLLNRVLSMGIDRAWRARTVRSLALEPGGKILDLATGTADLAIAIARAEPGASVLGTDPSRGMLAFGERKVRARGLAERVRLLAGDAQHIEADAASFDAITMAFGIRNVPDRMTALREMRRVGRAGARVAILELGEPRGGPLSRVARFHVRVLVPWIGALLSGAREYRYLQTSIAAFPPPEVFAAMMREAGLVEVSFEPLTFGACHLYTARVPVHEGDR